MLRPELILLLFAGGAALVVLIYYIVRQPSHRASTASNFEALPGMLRLANQGDALLVASEHGRLLHLNETAQAWLDIEGGEPNLEYLAELAQPSDNFLELFAGERTASFQIAGRWVEATSHIIPAGSDARTVIVMRPLAPQANRESYDLSRALNIVAATSDVVNASQSVEQVLQALLTITIREISADAGEINLYDEGNKSLTQQGWVGDTNYVLALTEAGGSYKLTDGITGWIARHGKGIVVGDLTDPSTVRPLLEKQPYQSFVGVPLMMGDRLVGTLEFASTRPHSFDAAHLALLNVVAKAFVTAIYNAELYAEQGRRMQDLAALPAHLQTTQDKGSVYKLLVERTARLLDADMAGILLYDDRASALIAQEPFVGLPAQLVRNYRIPLPAGSEPRRIYEQDSAWASADLADEPMAEAMRLNVLASAAGVRDILLVPLRLGNRRIGMLQASNRRTAGGFTRRDEETMHLLAQQAVIVIEEIRLYEQDLLRESEMMSLQEITQAFGEVSHDGDVFENANEQVARLMGVEKCGILLYEEKDSRLVARPPVYGLEEAYAEHYQIPLEPNGIIWHVWQEQDYWFTNDVSVDPISVGIGLADFAALVGVERTLLVPLAAGGRRFGVLQVSNKRNGENFTDKDARLLTIFAAQIAAMIENTRLFRQTQRRATEAESLRRIAELAGKVITVEDSFAPLLAEIAALLESPVAFINMVDPQTGNLVTFPRNVYGGDLGGESLVHDSFSANYEQSVFAARRSLLSNDASADRRVTAVYRAFVETLAIERLVFVPLFSGMTGLGELGVANREREYSDDDLRLMETLAPQLASALERLRLYDVTGQNLSRRMRELDAISRVTNELAQTLELDRVLEAIRLEALGVNEATGATIALIDSADAPGADLELVRRFGDADIEEIAAIESSAFTHATDVVMVEAYDEDPAMQPHSPAVRSAAAVAFTYEDRIVGVLHIYSDQMRRFDAQAREFLSTLAAKASLAYGNHLRYVESTDRSIRLRRRVEQLNQIFEIGHIFHSNADRNSLLEAVAYSVQQSVGFDIVLFTLVDPTTGHLRRVAQAGMPLDAFERSRTTTTSLAELEASLNPNFQVSESYFFPFEKLKDWGFNGLAALSMTFDGRRTLHPRGRNDWRDGDMLLVPLRGADGSLIGMISLDRPFEGKRPEHGTIEILEIFAHQVTIWLENTRLFAVSEQSAQQQAHLNDVLETVARTLDVTEIVLAVTEGVRRLFPFGRLTFALHDSEQSSYQVVRAVLADDGKPSISRERRANLARTALGHVHDTRSDLLVQANDALVSTFEDVRAWQAEGEQTSYVLPLLAGGLSLGALHLGSSEPMNEVLEATRPLIRRIANVAAVALQNARLFNQAMNSRVFNESVVESIQQGIVVLDSSGLIMTVNNYMKRRFGWSSRAVRQDLFAFRPSLKPILGDAVREVLKSGEPREMLEQTLVEAGETRIENLYLYPLLAADSVRGVVLLVDDITERYQLERDLAARASQLAALTDASSELSAHLDRETVIETMFTSMMQIIPYATMTLWQREDDELVLQAAHGAEPPANGIRIGIGSDPHVAQIVKTHQAAVHGNREEIPLPGSVKGRSWLGVPVTQQGVVTGMLMLTHSIPNAFDEQSKQAGLAFANQVAVALQNALLFNETTEQMERLSLINRVSMALAQSLDIENILEIALRELALLLGGDRGHAYVFERELSLARAIVDYPRGEEAPQRVSMLQESAALRHAFSSASPLIIPDVRELPHGHPLYAEIQARGMSAYVLIPMLVGGQTGGMFELEAFATPRPVDGIKVDLAVLIANQASIAVLNANLLEQTMVRTRELETLLEAAQATSFTLDLEEVLQSVVRLTVQALDMDDCLLMLYDNIEEELEVMVDFNRSGERKTLIEVGTSYDLLQYPTKRQAMQNLQVLILRVDSAEVQDPREIQDMRARGIITRIFVPLKARDEGIGLLQVDSTIVHRLFTHREARMAQALGAQAAISIENARLSTETSNQVAQSLVINDLSRAISSTMDLNVMLRIVRDQVPLLTDAEDVYLALYDSKTSLINFPLAVHNGVDFEIEPRPMSNDEVSFIIRQRRPLPLGGENPSIDEVRRNLGIRNGEGDAKRYLGVPLIAGDHVVGVLAVRDSVEPRPFGLNDQRILTTIGTQLGATIQNAQLFTEINERVEARTLELQQERDRLDALYRITSELVRTLDIDAALERALDLLAESLDADEGAILLYDPALSRLYAHSAVVAQVNPTERTRHVGDMIGEWLMTQGAPLLLEDLHRVPYWNENLSGAQPYRSAIAALLGPQEEEKGVIVFMSETVGHFSDAQLKLVTAAAYQMAAALKDAELYMVIRDRNEALARLLQSEQEERGKSSAILQSIADGVVVVDSEGVIALLNDAAERILEAPRNLVEGIPLEQAARLYGGRENNWAEQLIYWLGEARRQRGRYAAERSPLGDRFVNVQLSPVMTGDQSLGTVAVFRDVTRDMELDRRKSEFIANVSHELRTPLTSIKGYADLLGMGVGGAMSDQQSRFLGTIRENTERMTTLVNDLLQISTIDQARDPLNPVAVTLGEVIAVVLETTAQMPEHARKDILTATHLPPDLPQIEVDRVKLTHILSNIVDNAYNYTPANGRIDVTVTQPDAEHVRIAIADTGIGIPAEYHDRVWNRFERVEQHALNLAVAGTGLGLSIAREYVEMHGGRIWFDSELNKGTTFFIELPVRQSAYPGDNNGTHDEALTRETPLENQA
jgi:PAS domain S-box-containing protein